MLIKILYVIKRYK